MGRSSRLSRVPVTLALVARVAAVAVNVLFAACGLGGLAGLGAGPTVITHGLATVTITAAGINPPVVRESTTCPSSSCLFHVKFVNDDTVVHDLQSDPHPDHSTCAQFNTGVGRLEPGQSKEIVANSCDFSRFRGYHDETRLDDPRFQGQIAP